MLFVVEYVEIEGALVFQRLLCPGSSAAQWFTASCRRDGSLAVVQPLWVQQTAEASSACGSVHPHFAGNLHAYVRASGIEKGSCPTACATSPMLVGRHRSFRNWSIHHGRSPRWVGPHGPASAGFKRSTCSCPHSRRKICNFDYHAAAKMFTTATHLAAVMDRWPSFSRFGVHQTT